MNRLRAWLVTAAQELVLLLFWSRVKAIVATERLDAFQNGFKHGQQEARDTLLAEADNVPLSVGDIEARARELISDACACGAVLTISLEPGWPLAMRHYRMVADVRPTFYREDESTVQEGLKNG